VFLDRTYFVILHHASTEMIHFIMAKVLGSLAEAASRAKM
jgi:hypothetical protein